MNLDNLKQLGQFIPPHHFKDIEQYEDLLKSLGDTLDGLDDVIDCLDKFNVTEVNEIKDAFKCLTCILNDCYSSVDAMDMDVRYELKQAMQDEKMHVVRLNSDYWNSRL
jgi:hypothetical protein